MIQAYRRAGVSDERDGHAHTTSRLYGEAALAARNRAEREPHAARGAVVGTYPGSARISPKMPMRPRKWLPFE